MIYKFSTDRLKVNTYPIIPFGTIGWLKTSNNEVRQCKCVGAKWRTQSSMTPSAPIFEWKVAGIKEHVFSACCEVKKSVSYTNNEVITNPLTGKIYTTREYANNGSLSSKSEGQMVKTLYVNLIDILKAEYNLDDALIVTNVYDHIRESVGVKGYRINPDNSISIASLNYLEMEIVMDKNGIHIIIPDFLNGKVFTTIEQAKANQRMLPTYTFDDDEDGCDCDEENVKLTIEVDKKTLEQVKKVLEILDFEDPIFP